MVRSRTSPRSTSCWTASSRWAWNWSSSGRSPQQPTSLPPSPSGRRDGLGPPGCPRRDASGPSGRRPELIIRREQSVLEGVLDLLTGLLQVALGQVGPTLGLQFLVIGGPAEPLFGLSLDLPGLVLGLVIDAHGPRLLVEWSLLFPWIRSTKPRQGNPGSSRRLAFIGMAWDGWSVPPQRCAVGRGRQGHGVVSGSEPGSGAPGGGGLGAGAGQLH